MIATPTGVATESQGLVGIPYRIPVFMVKLIFPNRMRLKKHGHHGFWGMRQDEVDVPTELKKTEPQQRWEDARMRERTAAADTVPVDDYDGQPKASGYVPTPVDKAVHPDDYALSDPQLEFEISKAMKSNDEERLAALKIVRALRDPPKQPVKKKPYNKGMMAVASDWMEDF